MIYKVNKYCVLNNDSNPSNCNWKEVGDSSNRIFTKYCCFDFEIKSGNKYNLNLFIKDSNNNMVTKIFEFDDHGVLAPCMC